MLSRYRTPSQRQADDSAVWKYDYSTLSKVFNSVVDWFDDTHVHRLRQLPNITHKFASFNAAILAKIRADCPSLDVTGGMPPDAFDCALFGDGSRFKVSFVCQYCVPIFTSYCTF
jgi:hypothetical protein